MRRTLVLCALVLMTALLLWMGWWKGWSVTDEAPAPVAGVAAEALGAGENVSAGTSDELVAATASESPLRREARPVDPTADEPLTADTGTLLVRTVLEGGTPLPEVEVVIVPRRPARLGAGIRRLRTDATGTVRVERLAGGDVSVWSPRGPRTSVGIVAGQEAEVELVFKGVVDVHGIVVDPAGEPVAGARVWLSSWRRDWLGLHLATRSDADGRFAIGHVQVGKSLGATASLFGPSELTDLSQTDTSSSPVELRLALTAEGGDLVGHVTDASRNPVAGARVAAGESPTGYDLRDDGTEREQWTAFVTETDAEGRYRLDGMRAGACPVSVQSAGYPLLATEVEVVTGRATVLDLELERGMRVRGVVRDERGEPAEGAILLALDAPFDDPFPTQGPTERGVPFNRPGVRSGADGSFLLPELSPGVVHLYGSKGASFWDTGDFEGTVQETLSGGPGQTLEWNPVLSRGYRIRGRLTYADGAPISNVFVSAIRPEDDRRYTAHADKQGRFSIPGLEHRAYKIWVQLGNLPEGTARMEHEDVWPSEQELLLVADFSRTVEQKGIVHATIADVANRIEGKGAILFAHDEGWYNPVARDGVFSSRLPPGRYQARVMSGDDLVGTSEWFDLTAGEERHLGDVHTSPACRMRVRVTRPAELSNGLVFVAVQTDYRPKQAGRKLTPDEDELVFEDLLEGPVEVQLSSNIAAFERRRIELRQGELTEVELRLKPAALCSFELVCSRTEGFGHVTLTLTDSAGGFYHELEWFERYGAELPFTARLRVPVGRYTVEAVSSEGLSASGKLAVESLDATPALRLELE